MEHQFETLESVYDFVTLLAETVADAKSELESDVRREALPSRRLDALRTALYNVSKLEKHVAQTSRILNDLRTLRPFLFEERQVARGVPSPDTVRFRLPGDGQPQAAVRLVQSVAA